MTPDELRDRIPEGELKFRSSRSGGPGGQNVNKVNTRVELIFDLQNTIFLTENEKVQLINALGKRINRDGEILLVSQSERTQSLNKKKVVNRFYKLLSAALTKKKVRKKTIPTKASKIRRVEEKKKRQYIKKLRQDPGIREE